MDSVAQFNERALALRASGDFAGAISAFRDGIERHPDNSLLLQNCAFVLDEAGFADAALSVYDRAIALNPRNADPRISKGLLLFRQARNDEAQAALLSGLEIEPNDVRANFAMYELLHVKGDLRAAVTFQRRALERQQLLSSVAPEEQRSVLILCAPGDFQANIPVDFLFDRRTTSIHKLFILDRERLRTVQLPRHDVILNAIAESPDSVEALAIASEFLHSRHAPKLNAPERVAATNRVRLLETLRAVDCRLAAVDERTRAEAAKERAFPLIIRPVGSHAGHGLEKIADACALDLYLASSEADSFYVSPFVDYSNGDGYFRKYRIIFVDGEAFPCHLAISPHWMIHYYNAPMAENQWMRDEEARFLQDIGNAFDERQRAVLHDLAHAVGLEYFGIDCTIDREGRVFVFEADPAMLVHTSDPIDLYPYKHRYIPRIFAAVERMIDRRRSAIV